MCQILTVTVKNNKKIIEDCVLSHRYKIKWLLNEKGGETYSFIAINTSTNEIIDGYCYNKSKFDNTWNEFSKNVLEKLEEWDKKSKIVFVFFSRQAPEMEYESGDVEPAPYLENNMYVWMHGTVSNLPEIEKALGKEFTVDSQAIAYYDELAQKNIIIKGVFAAIVYDFETNKIKWLYNGIGRWDISYECNGSEIIWEGTTNNLNTLAPVNHLSRIMPTDNYPYYYDLVFNDKNKNELNVHCYIAFSGGMDIVMSSYVNIRDSVVKVNGELASSHTMFAQSPKYKYIFVYFDYGANARKHEIAAMKKFYELMKEEFPHIEFEYRIIDVKNLFNEISRIGNHRSKLMDANSVGDIRETEGNLAYVPYRNTEFALLLGAMIDKDLEEKLFIPHIIFGMNLTEMSVYVDNTFAWLQSVENTIMYGGKNYKCVDIIAPFINVTKTNMLAYMMKNYGYDKTKELLNISFSCYYPDENGKPCGKCGSCILREKAFERATKATRKKIIKKGVEWIKEFLFLSEK